MSGNAHSPRMRRAWVGVALLVVACAAGTVVTPDGANARATLRGELTISVAMHGDGHVAHRDLVLQADTGQHYLLDGSPSTEASLAALAGSTVDVIGEFADDVGRVSSIRTQAAAHSAEGPATGLRTAVVVLFTFAAKPGAPSVMTPAEAHGVMTNAPNSLRNFWREESGGTLDLVTTVVQDVLPASYGSGCNWGGWGEYFEPRYPQYDHVLLVPPFAGCDWSGRGNMPGSLSMYPGGIWPQAAYHELGHNLGFDHALSVRCTEGGRPVPIGTTCDVVNYGDLFDPMAIWTGLCGYNVFRREVAGWPVHTVTAPAGGGTVTLRAADLPATGAPQVMRLPRATDSFGSAFTFQWRVQDFPGCTGGWQTEPRAPGMLVHIVQQPQLRTPSLTYLLDMQPSTPTFEDAYLPVGGTFVDPASGARVTLQSLGATEATLVVSAPTTNVSIVGNQLRYAARDGEANSVQIVQDGTKVSVSDSVPVTRDPASGCTQFSDKVVHCPLAGISSVHVDLGDGNDTFRSRATLPVTVLGGPGDDIFRADATVDGPTTYRGGAGTDHVEYKARSAPVTIRLDTKANDGAAGERDFVVKDVEQVTGGTADDRLLGNSKANYLDGWLGNDFLKGGKGTDTLVGGFGDDDVRAKDAGADTRVDCGPGRDTVVRDVNLDTPLGCETLL